MTTYAASWLRAGALSSHRLQLAGIVALAGALRFSELGARGFWRDEAVTVELVRKGLGGMLGAIPDSEGTPPLYYVVSYFSGWDENFRANAVTPGNDADAPFSVTDGGRYSVCSTTAKIPKLPPSFAAMPVPLGSAMEAPCAVKRWSSNRPV